MPREKLTRCTSFCVMLSSKVCDDLMHMCAVTALRSLASTHSLCQYDRHCNMSMCGIRIVFHSVRPSFAPNPGRSHGLTQLWVMRKDPKTGAVDKASLKQVTFEEELYEVAVRTIRCFGFTHTRLYQIDICVTTPYLHLPTPIVTVSLAAFVCE